MVEAMRPVDISVDTQRVGRVDEAEEIGVAGAGALEVKAAINLVSMAERLVQVRTQRILMAAIEHRNLVVVERVTANVGRRIKLQQRLGLGADRNHVAGKRRMGRGVVDDNRLAKWVEQIGKVAAPLRLSRHQAGLILGGTVACPLVGYEERRPTR